MTEPNTPAHASKRHALPRGGAVLVGLLIVSIVAISRAAAAAPELSFENGDGLPWTGRVAFSRIAGYANDHQSVTVRVRNTGDAALSVAQLTLTAPWQFNPKPALPATVAPGAALDVPVIFNATDGDYWSGTLGVVSNDADEATATVELGGFWQRQTENDQEPGLGHVVRAFGISTTNVSPGQNLNRQGRVEAVGDEILSPYWSRVDASRPVSVRQLSAFHGCCDPATQSAYIQWYPKGNPGARVILFRHAGIDSQTIMPRQADPNTGQPYADNRPAQGTFNPSGLFGFRVDGEYSDSSLNNPDAGTSTPCGTTRCHRVRFWPARSVTGALLPNTYFVAGDYNTSNANYDYNDNVYLLENVAPETAPTAPSTAQSLYRVDAGGARQYLDSNGNWWQPDAGLFAPATVPPEGITAGQGPTDIALTRDDWLFSSYRGYRGSIPQDQRTLTYELPTGGSGTYYVRLYFAERYWTQANERIQDVLAEGAPLSPSLQNLDIFTRAGGKDRALVSSSYPVNVTDGALTLTLRADADQVAVSGIEVFCASTCPGSPPQPPTTTPLPSATALPSLSPTPSATAIPGLTPTSAPGPSPTPTSTPRPSAGPSAAPYKQLLPFMQR